MTTSTWLLRTFNELTNDELYNILKLRNAIFILDQQCVFADLDGKDQTYCYHFFCTRDRQIIAYARIFGPGQVYQEACISRVCTSLDQRGKGIGKELMKRALDEMSRLFPGESIRIGAQLYLKPFYESFGFKIDGDVYIEDGIEHIQMIRKEPELSKLKLEPNSHQRRKNSGAGRKMNLNNLKMNVIETAGNGIVNELTIFTFSQKENFISATYSGGQILKGYLVGTLNQNKLSFSYCQLQTNGKMDNGQSECDVLIENEKIRLVEHFTWASRNGETGINILQEL